jgi:PAS domain S-box-containing protein
LAQQPQSLSLLSSQTGNAKASGEKVHQSEEVFRLLVESVQDYAIFLLDKDGTVKSWNLGAERLKGYKATEIIGQHFSLFYPQEAKDSGWPGRELELASKEGRFADEGWRIRKDGSAFWASVVITALRDAKGELRGFSKVTRDLTERRNLEDRTQQLNKELRNRLAQLVESRRQIELRTMELHRLSGQLLRVQDDERRHIARELHDELGQQLVAIKLALQSPGHGSIEEQKADAVQLTNEALSKVRNLSHLLHPPLLDESGLMPALHWYIDGLQKRSQLRIAFDVKPTAFPRLTSDIETVIFRVIQESLTNIFRHSGSAGARIELHRQTDRVVIRVRDFGKGIEIDDTAGSLPQVGVGIGGMRERVKQLGGNFKVSRAEPGTLVEVSLPLLPSEIDELI